MAKKRAFVKYTKEGNIIPGSLIITTSGGYPISGLYYEVPMSLCCLCYNYTIQSSSTNTINIYAVSCDGEIVDVTYRQLPGGSMTLCAKEGSVVVTSPDPFTITKGSICGFS